MVAQEIITSEKTFSTNWWKNTFLETTTSLTKTSFFNNCMSSNDTQVMREDIVATIRTLCELKTTELGFQVYIEGNKATWNDMDHIYNNPPQENEAVEDWIDRIFPDKKVGMIIERGEKLNNALAKNIAHKITPFIDEIGTPLLGINFTIVISSTGWSPEGIFKGDKGESILFFQLNESDHEIHTWESQNYNEFKGAGKSSVLEVEENLPKAKTFSFHEGDVCYVTSGDFHISRSENTTVGVTLQINNHQKSDLANKLLRVIVDQYLEEHSEFMTPDKNSIEDLSASRQAIESFNLPEDLEYIPFQDLIEETFKDFKYSLYSNSGYWTRPFSKEEQTSFELNDRIILEKPFHIPCIKSIDGDNIFIYVRGTKLVLHYHECIRNLIDEINKGEEMTVIDALSFLNNEWDESIGFYILNLLDTHHGIKKLAA